jgi:hypothetical protein
MADTNTLPPSQGSAQDRPDTLGESMINLTLLDPARWGWTAAGAVADLLPPHEVRACLRKMILFLPECPVAPSFVIS